MTKLPTPAGLGSKKFLQDGGIKVAPVELKEVEYPPHLVEYGKNGNKLVFHFFKDGVFPISFRSKLYNALLSKFSFGGNEANLLSIDWIQEFDSWCVVIKDVLQLSPPPSEENIKEFLDFLLS